MKEGDNKEKVDLILKNGIFITMDKKFRIIKNGAISIKAGKIVDIDKSEKILNNYFSEKEVDLNNSIVHPAFINSHHHLASHIIRCWIPDHFGTFDLWDLVEEKFFKSLNPEIEYLSTALACTEMLLSGTTAFMDIGVGFSIESQMAAIEDIGIRGIVSRRIEDGDTVFSMPTKKCLSVLEEDLKEYGYKPGRKTWCVGTVYGIDVCSNELMSAAKKLADKYNTIMSAHSNFSEPDIEIVMKKNNGKRPIEVYDEIGILNSQTTLTHLNCLSDKELELVLNSNISGVHCPEITMRYAFGYSRSNKFPEMLNSGVKVGLGTDCCHISCNSANVGKTMRIAALSSKEGRCMLSAISSDNALKMATIYGAKALGIDDRLGSFEIGKDADIVIHRADKPECYPLFDVVNNLVYSMGTTTINDVLIQGEYFVKDSKLTKIDPADIYEKVETVTKKLREKLDYPYQDRWPVE